MLPTDQDNVRYVHAADLHLDAPFQGISSEAAAVPHLARLLREATFTALEKLQMLCEAERPHFVVLAGDIYNHENFSVKAQMRLRDACESLASLGMPVFIAHGNHDPLSSRFSSISWPDNVTIFDSTMQSRLVERDGAPIAVVHGISHSSAREQRNLSSLFQRDASHDCFQLGVLHCSLEGDGKADRYAPASLDDLRKSGLDAWALGHVHERRVLCEQPFVAYSGNPQGLHINESGPRGCLLVSARKNAGGYVCEPVFHRLSPVIWQKIELDAGDLENLDELERQLSGLLEETAASSPPDCLAIMARIVITGRSALDAILRDRSAREDILERMRHFANASPAIWIKDMLVESSPRLNLQELAMREDLVGELARLISDLRAEPARLREIALECGAELYSHPRLRRALSEPDESDIAIMLDNAEKLCMELLENS